MVGNGFTPSANWPCPSSRSTEHERYGLLDEQVKFLKGWFKDTLPDAPTGPLAILRIDGRGRTPRIPDGRDGSFYDRVSPGGYIIVDDYRVVAGCQKAVNEFRARRGIDDAIVEIDGVRLLLAEKQAFVLMNVPATFHSSIVQQKRDYQGIHGLRGIAALAVVLYHTVHIAGLPRPRPSLSSPTISATASISSSCSAPSRTPSTESSLGRTTSGRRVFRQTLLPDSSAFLSAPAWHAAVARNPSADLLESIGKILLNLTFTFGLYAWNGVVWAGW